MDLRRVMRRTGLGIAAAAAVALVAPVAVFWCPLVPAWRDHAYRNLMYNRIAHQVFERATSEEDVVARFADYVQTHVWPPLDESPYDGKALDYLIRGIGWCDYQAKVYRALLASYNIPARYAMLRRTDGISPHTVAEVWSQGRWGVYDTLFGFRFTDREGRPLTWEMLAENPSLIEANPTVQHLARVLPEEVAEIRHVYASVLTSPVPPSRSATGLERLSVFDRLLLAYVRWAGRRLFEAIQDRYLASKGYDRPADPAQRLRLARHWHLAGRTELAREAYRQCIEQAKGTPLAAEARWWVGLLEWELDQDPAAAERTWRQLVAEDPASHWVVPAQYYLGRCEELLGHPEAAQQHYRQASRGGFIAAWIRLRS